MCRTERDRAAAAMEHTGLVVETAEEVPGPGSRVLHGTVGHLGKLPDDPAAVLPCGRPYDLKGSLQVNGPGLQQVPEIRGNCMILRLVILAILTAPETAVGQHPRNQLKGQRADNHIWRAGG